jgi:hypothetical protein
MQPFVGLTQLLEGGFEEGLVFDFLSCTQSGQAVEPHINSHGGWFLHRDGIRDLDLDGNTPPIRCFGDACPFHTAHKPELLSQIDPSEPGDPHAMIPQLELIVGKVKGGFAFFLALELGASGFAFKKRGEGFSQIEEGLI